MNKKTTSLKIDPSLWKEVKKACIDKEIEISEYIENLIKKDLKKIKFIFFALFLCFFFSNFVSASHWITGYVEDSLDGVSPNDKRIVIWNPVYGISENITDIIGENGNSGSSNIYFLDCELLAHPCQVGDEIRAKVINSGDDYITAEASIIVSGAGFDIVPTLRLNSPPNASLIYPINYYNTSNQEINLSCVVEDLDSNLANVTLYGNWTGMWHANETKSVSGSYSIVNFTKNLPEGKYSWSCVAADNLSISKPAVQNRTIILDFTPPTIESAYFNSSSTICDIFNTARINCTVSDALTGIFNVTIQANKPSGSKPHYKAELLIGNTYYADVPLNEIGFWNFTCIASDYVNNKAYLNSSVLEVREAIPDILIKTTDIVFYNMNPIENETVKINATIQNQGCLDANNFLVGFYDGDPANGGIQIGENLTTSINSLNNKTLSLNWSAKIGKTNIFVYADINNSINELNETNNKANKTINVTSWQIFYGNVTIGKILGDENLNNLSIWYNETNKFGVIFVADMESAINWNSLQSIGRNKTGGISLQDFNQIDYFLGTSNLEDSVSNVFTTDGQNPKQTDDFFIRQNTINYVPIDNSTENSNFKTGILWDAGQDTDGKYGGADKEPLIFVSKINKFSQGGYGIYDYEIKIPVKIREYYTTDTSKVYFYFEIN